MTSLQDSTPRPETEPPVEPQPPERRGPSALIIAPLFGLVLTGLFGWGLFSSSGDLPSTLIQKPVPQFTLPPVKGRSEGLATKDLMGQVTLVNFFASWCVACRAEHPLFMEISRKGLVPLYGINYKDQPDDAQSWLKDMGDPYGRIGADIKGRVAIDWGVYGIPETFVIAPDGTVAFKLVGAMTRETLDNKIMPIVEKLRAEAAGKTAKAAK